MTNKSPDAFRTISEVADWVGVPTHVLRFWESRFAQVKPVKRAGGRRYYRPVDMALLGGIRKLLHEDGMTIRGVQKLLREEGVKHVSDMAPPLTDTEMRDVTPANVVQLDKAREQDPVAETERSSPAQIDEAELAAPEPEVEVTSPDAKTDPATVAPDEPPHPTLPSETEHILAEADEAPNAEAIQDQTDSEIPDLDDPDLDDTVEGIELHAHDAEPATADWLDDTPDAPLPDAPLSSPEAASARQDDAAAAQFVQDPAGATAMTDSPEDAHNSVGAPSETGPQFGDISHIPDDPPEIDADFPFAPESGLLITLANARKSGSGPQNKVGLTMIIERLTALRARMGQGKSNDPRP